MSWTETDIRYEIREKRDKETRRHRDQDRERAGDMYRGKETQTRKAKI